MRLLVTFALAGLFVITAIARAEEQGSIGVQIELRDGKIAVKEPIKGSPAEKAGIKADDVIVKIDDHKVKDNAEPEDLQSAVAEIVKRKPGDKIKIGIKRGDKDMTIEVTVGKRSEIFPPKD